MALHRKTDALLALNPDIAIISECAMPEVLRAHDQYGWMTSEPVWIGENRNKGLAVFTFNGYTARLHEPYHPTLGYIAPVHIDGPLPFNLLAVWAQNASAGLTRKHQLGPLRRALGKYREFLTTRDAVVAGDFNSNAIWDKPGWRINHMTKVAIFEGLGLHSAYHRITGEEQGKETTPTLYWRDRRRDGPTYHIDYAFLPKQWFASVTDFSVGSFDDWCGNGLSDHVPLCVEIDHEGKKGLPAG